MTRRIFLGIALVATLLTGATNTASAETPPPPSHGTDPSGEKHMIMPVDPWSPDNPYAKQLPEARKAAMDALSRLQALIQKDPFNFDAQVQAYYAYVRAQARVQVLQDMARQWENKRQGHVSGRVLSLAGLDYWPVPMAETAGVQTKEADAGDAEKMIAPDMLRKATPVSGAKVTLRPQRFWIMANGQEPAHAEHRQAGDVKPAIWPPKPNPGPVYTATSGRDGAFEFKQDVPADSYAMTVTKNGFESWHGIVEVPKSGKLQKNVYLSEFRSLLGSVSTIPMIAMKELRSEASAGAVTGSARADSMPVTLRRRFIPVEGAEVSLRPQPIIYRHVPDGSAPGVGAIPPQHFAKTNAKGQFRVKGVKAGRWILEISKKGLQHFSAPIVIRQTLQRQDIVMLPEFNVPVPMTKVGEPATREAKPMDAPGGASLDKPFEP